MMRSVPRPGMIRLLILLLSFCLSHFSYAQDAPAVPPSQTQPRPRIGLALGGGAALGLSEIGIIRWMEDNHVPVDRIAGTSMGSIIGAMYATGMSPAEIQAFAEKIDWDEAFSSEPSYSQLSYRRKQDRRDYLINAALGLKHGLSGPNGLNSGQGIGLLLDRIAFPQSEVATFDDFPIPFRCVATDMLSGQGVVLRDGSLAQAVRASMAIPGVFTPVTIGGHLLADGGMVQNIPVETVLAMDADVVIAVELRLAPGNLKDLETITGVLSRAVSVMITQNERRSLALAKANVSIGMDGFTITDYSRVKELVELGYKTAASQSASLLPYALHDSGEWQEYLDTRAARRRRAPDKIHAVEVAGADADTDKRIAHRLSKET